MSFRLLNVKQFENDAVISLIRLLGANFNGIWINMQKFSNNTVDLEMS